MTSQVSSSTTLGSRGRLCFPDALRGIAALWVFLYHLSEGKHVVALEAALPHWAVTAVFDAGHLGVPIFFVLSGYVMALTTAKNGLSPSGAVEFMGKRLLRISPPYYFSIVFVCVFLLLKQHALKAGVEWPTVPSLLLHAVYLQNIFAVPHINIIYWTLCIEMQFYVVMSIIEVLLKRARFGADAVTWAWFLLACLALYWPLFEGGEPRDVYFMQTWFSFLSGILVSRFSTARTRLAKSAIAGYLLFVLGMGVVSNDTFAMTAGVVGLSLLLAVRFGGLTHWLDWWPLQRLGLISYSVYLLHNPVTGAVSAVVHKVLGQGVRADAAVAVAAWAAVVVAASLSYRYIEVPSIGLARRFSCQSFGRWRSVPRPG